MIAAGAEARLRRSYDSSQTVDVVGYRGAESRHVDRRVGAARPEEAVTSAQASVCGKSNDLASVVNAQRKGRCPAVRAGDVREKRKDAATLNEGSRRAVRTVHAAGRGAVPHNLSAVVDAGGLALAGVWRRAVDHDKSDAA